MPKTSAQKQAKRKAELQAAAERDGFSNWSQALTAWKNGEAVMMRIESKPLDILAARAILDGNVSRMREKLPK